MIKILNLVTANLYRRSKNEQISWSKFLFDCSLHCESHLETIYRLQFLLQFLLCSRVQWVC